MTHVELERFLFVTGPLDAHANAFLAWITAEPKGTIITAGHLFGKKNGKPVTQLPITFPILGETEVLEFKNPAVPNKDLAYSRRTYSERGLTVAPKVDYDERLYITGFYNQRPFAIPVRVHNFEGGQLILVPDTIGLARPGMSGSAVVNEGRQVVGVLVSSGHTPDTLIAELLRDIR